MGVKFVVMINKKLKSYFMKRIRWRALIKSWQKANEITSTSRLSKAKFKLIFLNILIPNLEILNNELVIIRVRKIFSLSSPKL